MSQTIAPSTHEIIAQCPKDLMEQAISELKAGGLEASTSDEVTLWAATMSGVVIHDINDHYTFDYVVGNNEEDLENIWWEGEVDVHMHEGPAVTLSIWPEGGPNMSTLLYSGLLLDKEVNYDRTGIYRAEKFVKLKNGVFVPREEYADRLSLFQAGNGELVKITGPHSAPPLGLGLSRLVSTNFLD